MGKTCPLCGGELKAYICKKCGEHFYNKIGLQLTRNKLKHEKMVAEAATKKE